MRLFQPAARPLIALLARFGVDPQAVVLTHTAIGLVAALLIARGGPGAVDPAWVAAALLLQVKTLLDNSDGGLARATGRVTQMGRYLDTVMDLLTNAALFAALATHGPPLAAAGAFLVLMVVLSVDFNMERRYRLARAPAGSDEIGETGETGGGERAEPRPPPGAPPRVLAAFRAIYRSLLAPQDRWIARADAALFGLAYGAPYRDAPNAARRAWSDLFSTAAVVDLGLSTQLALLGALLAAGRPFLYVWAVFAQGAWVLCVQLLRVARMRSYRRSA